MTKIKSYEFDRSINAFITNKIEMAMKIQAFSQKEISQILNISSQQMHKYCKNINRISAAKLFTLSQAINVPIDFFFPIEKKAKNIDYDIDAMQIAFDQLPNEQKLEFIVYCLNVVAQTPRII
jgi:transcriptional regulator with XRE-family HTH domain